MTKAQQIMSLYDGKRTTSEIAQIVGCDPAYVRVVGRQRNGTKMSKADKKWRSSEKGRRCHSAAQQRYAASNPEYRERQRLLKKASQLRKRAEASL